MLKKIVYTIIMFTFAIFTLTGCVNLDSNEMVQINSPKNDELSIQGNWKVENYTVIDKNIYSKDNIDELDGGNILIDSSRIKIGSKEYSSTRYKLKVVNSDYEVSYGSKLTVDNLGIKLNEIEVITASDKNNMIFDFFRNGDNDGYIYYQGVLLKVKKVSDISDKEFEKSNNVDNDKFINQGTKYRDKGLYLTLKTPRIKLKDGSYSDEKYRTLWISYIDGSIKPIEEVKGILFPRMSGMWVLNKEYIEKDGIRQEYFTTSQFKREHKEVYKIQGKNNIYRNINYISNNYILTEDYVGDKFENKFTEFSVLPVDNLFAEKGIVISDIYPKSVNAIYEADYQKELNSLTEDELKDVRKYIDYSNFSVIREEGKWSLIGRISPIKANGKFYDYNLNIKPNENLVNFDALSIPWGALRGEVPLLKDAYMSPDGKLAIILIDNELLVYNVIDGNRLQESPAQRYELGSNEEVIMSDWCESDYVELWGNTFKEFKKEVNKEE